MRAATVCNIRPFSVFLGDVAQVICSVGFICVSSDVLNRLVCTDFVSKLCHLRSCIKTMLCNNRLVVFALSASIDRLVYYYVNGN